MPNDMARRRPARWARRLLLIFVTTILAPGVMLAGFGLLALKQERQRVDSEARNDLRVFAETLGRRLELDLTKWQQAAVDVARSGSVDPSRLPAPLRDAIMTPGAGVILLGSRESAEAYPRGQLLYELTAAEEDFAPHHSSARFTEAESLERRKQYDQAIPIYQRLATSTDRAEHAEALYALGRSLRKASAGANGAVAKKQLDEALHAFQRLAREPSSRITLGMLPSDLLALSEIASNGSQKQRLDASLVLYRGLVGGQWRLDEAIYSHQSEEVIGWLPQNEETRRLREQEVQKLALSRAVERFVDSPRALSVEDGSAAIAFWSEQPFAAIVLGAPYVRDHLLPDVDRDDVSAALSTVTGEHLAGLPSIDASRAVTYPLQRDVPLRLQVWRTDPAALVKAVDRRQQRYLAMLAVLVALVGFGGYITLRTVRAELAVAQMKSDFVSTVSHEFRSPLASINQLGEMLRDGIVADEGRRQEYYGMIVTESQRLRRLVENVLDFARMEDGRKQYRFEAVDSAEWLREIADDFQAQVAPRGFAVETDIPPDLPPIVVDRENLATAVKNLLDNAVKYSPESRTVRLEAQTNGDGISIAVRDRGIGIGDEDRPRIFDKFYRGAGELSREIKGVGLGLTLVHQIVSAHEGTIDVESRQGEGSTFTIRLKAV
jgi:signal transduction histidine kinase